MRKFNNFVLVVLASLCITAQTIAGGGVLDVFWELNGGGWDLYAGVTADTVILNADLGDQNIDLPPGGINTGLFSTNGDILGTSSLALGTEDESYARASRLRRHPMKPSLAGPEMMRVAGSRIPASEHYLPGIHSGGVGCLVSLAVVILLPSRRTALPPVADGSYS